MFAKMVGRRATALATSLAVVIGLAITPAFTATAAEGDHPAIVETPVAELVEAPPALLAPPVVETPAAEPVEELPPVAEFVEAPAEEAATEETPAEQSPIEETPAQLAELIEPTADEWSAPQMMRSAASDVSRISIQATEIQPPNIGTRIVGQPVTIRFTSESDPERWGGAYAYHWLGSEIQLSRDGVLTGAFKYPGEHKLTVNALKKNWLVGWLFGGDIVDTKTYVFDVLPAITTTSLSEATVGEAYSQTLDATRSSSGLITDTFAITDGELPAGLTLNKWTGTISDTTTATPGTYVFSVQMTSSYLYGLAGSIKSMERELSITVRYPAPIWDEINLPEATVDQLFTPLQLMADGDGALSYTATGLPAGMTFTSDGVLSGTPSRDDSYGSSETFLVEFTADNGRSSTTTAELVVKSPPAFVTMSPLPDAVVGTPYSTTIETLGPDVTYTLVNGPAGMVIDPSTGALSGWTPSDEQNVRVAVRISNLAGESFERFTIRPFEVPAINTTTLVSGIVGQNYSDQIVFAGRNAKITKTGGTLPNGVKLENGTANNDGGILSGTPTQEGVFSFTVTVTNGAGATTHDFEIRVHDVPVIHVTNLDRAVVGQAYSDRVQFSGIDAVATVWRGDLPTGLTLNADGTFSGAPTEVGVFKFTVRVQNLAGAVNHRYRIVSFDVPVFTTTLDQGIVGMAYSQQLTADGHNVRFVVPRSSSLPAGLTLDRNGLLHGTPTVAGDFTFDIRARNFAGTTLQSFTLTVTEPIMTLSTGSILRGGSLTVTGSGYLPGDQLEFWLHSTPVLLGTVTSVDGTFTKSVTIPANTPDGAHDLVVVGAKSGTQSMPLTVTAPPAAPQQPRATTPSQSPALTVTPADESTIDDADESEDSEVEENETEEDLPTLPEPQADEEAAAVTPVNVTGFVIAAIALLLAALVLWFILWRRRRAMES